ncbi:MAG TPA: acylphosphatase [Capillimicrobium sp.]|nr:acylphosphatase [Capillimicrobium sp.]
MRRRVIVSGRVQGVFFRDSAREEAERLGVHGWIRNLDDGKVEAVLEGDADAVEELIAWMRRGGPPRARVDDVAVFEESPEGLRGFEVR